MRHDKNAYLHVKTSLYSKIGVRTIIVSMFFFVVLNMSYRSASASTYYVDCSARAGSGAGSQKTPFVSLDAVNALQLQPGDEVRFLRGTSCSGTLAPQGSGAPGMPITIGAYGVGKRPAIIGTGDSAVTLHNQQYLVVKDLEISGGRHYGLHYYSDIPNRPMNYLRVRDLDVHGAAYVSKVRGDSGEVVIESSGANGVLNNVLVDGVTAHDSTASEGILVNAGGAYVWPETQPTRGNRITVQNSTVHNVYGDGILIMNVVNGLMQDDVVYESGLCPECRGSTPGGLWEWQCHSCTVQNNESYANQTWGVGDGGAFDIDYHNYNNVVQYNYGHDTAGYCISVFGAAYDADQNNVIRYNICSNNERLPNAREINNGDIFLSTWEGGSIDGLQIYNNTFYWNPARSGALLQTTSASFSGSSANFFKNNIIYSSAPNMIQTTSNLILNNNIYWVAGDVQPVWSFNNNSYTSLQGYQAATGQDALSCYADPKLIQPAYHRTGRPFTAFLLRKYSPALKTGAVIPKNGGRDFWGLPVSSARSPNIGAYNGPGLNSGSR